MCYLCTRTGPEVLSARIVLTLLAEARGVPVNFAVLLPSGNIVLEVGITFQYEYPVLHVETSAVKLHAICTVNLVHRLNPLFLFCAYRSSRMQ